LSQNFPLIPRGLSAGKRNERWLIGCRLALVRPAGVMAIYTDQYKLLQIVLLGQPELRKILARPKLRQLQQRITVRYHLDALSSSETENYVFHRLHVAGVDSRDMFSSWALRRIHSYSGGLPRLNNVVCDRALLAGYVGGESQLTTRHVRQAVRELGGRLE